MMFEVEAK